MKEGYKYFAFISYSHRDKKTVKKLQRRLESYHLPSALKKSNPNLPKNLKPVFIDELDLVAKGTLKTALQDNLRRSNYLIVICSPSSAKSPYVNDEVKYFIDSGRTDHIIPLIAEGVPHSGDPLTECFMPAILGLPRRLNGIKKLLTMARATRNILLVSSTVMARESRKTPQRQQSISQRQLNKDTRTQNHSSNHYPAT